MTAISDALAERVLTGRLRPVEPYRDMLAIADLVEVCFRDTLDDDGLDYLRQIRSVARNNSFLTMAYNFAEQAANMPATGYVWEEHGRVVGNASLIPIAPGGQKGFLIANVAVHPDFRGRGLGRRLTAAAMEAVRRRKIASVWLQVRQDNEPAVHIYRDLGFIERARRTTWKRAPAILNSSSAAGVEVGRRKAADWALQLQWIHRLYPLELRWHLPICQPALTPGLWGFLYRVFSLTPAQHWVVTRYGRLVGALTCFDEVERGDNLILAAPQADKLDEPALRTLFVTARQKLGRRRLSLNLPAGYAANSLLEAGFEPYQTLLWMEAPLE